MPTYEVECRSCHELRWPMLPARPETYTCVRCTALGPAKRAKRVEIATRRAQRARNERQTTRRTVCGPTPAQETTTR